MSYYCTEEVLTEGIINPINNWFHSKKLVREQILIYFQGLADLKSDLLGKTMSELIRTYKGKSPPSIAEIREAHDAVCRRPVSPPPNTAEAVDPNLKHPWQRRQAKINEEVEYYAKQFRESTLCRRAYSEGWLEELLAFVRTIAKLQAQIIHSNPQKSYDAGACGYLAWNKDLEGFIREVARETRKVMQINVLVPIEAIEFWSNAAKGQQPNAA